jgi:uncharacterized protein (TIGR04141 family)
LQVALEKYWDELSTIDMGILDGHKVYCIDVRSEEVYKIWSLYKCIYYEVLLNKEKFLLSAGKWYQIDQDYYKDVVESIKTIEDYNGKCKLLTYEELREDEYNIRVEKANHPDAILMDKKNIRYGGSQNQIELCDIFYAKNEFIHIKRFRGSSTLSHLFLQGLNPATLLLESSVFLAKANEIIAAFNKQSVIPSGIVPYNYSVVYAIATSDKDRDLKDILPFFSKVSLMHVFNRLKAYNYNVRLAKIILNEEEIKKKEIEANKQKKNNKKTKK